MSHACLHTFGTKWLIVHLDYLMKVCYQKESCQEMKDIFCYVSNDWNINILPNNGRFTRSIFPLK